MRVLILCKKLNVSFPFLSQFVELCTFFIDYQSTLVLFVTVCRAMFFFFIGYQHVLVEDFFKYCTSYNPYVPKLYFTEMVKPDKSRYFTDFSVKPVVK